MIDLSPDECRQTATSLAYAQYMDLRCGGTGLPELASIIRRMVSTMQRAEAEAVIPTTVMPTQPQAARP